MKTKHAFRNQSGDDALQAENDTLPQTGPEHWLLLLVAVML